jgi:hypothetical protein
VAVRIPYYFPTVVLTRQGPSFVFYETTWTQSNVYYAKNCAGEEEKGEVKDDDDDDEVCLRHNS